MRDPLVDGSLPEACAVRRGRRSGRRFEEADMAHVVVLGAGLGGVIMAYEVKEKLGATDKLTVVNLGSTYSFVPSNPWVAVGWRKREEVSVDLAPTFANRGIALRPEGAK